MSGPPLPDADGFVHDPRLFVGVVDAGWIIVGVADRDAFDRIGAPCVDHGLNERGHVLTKCIQGATAAVVFQHWLKSPA